jgi:hypothetical protein
MSAAWTMFVGVKVGLVTGTWSSPEHLRSSVRGRPAKAADRGGSDRRHGDTSNSRAEFATLFLSTRAAFLDHEKAKTELKGLMPEPILIDPHGNCARVVIEVALHQRDIAKCCREQHVGSGPLCDEESRDLGAITDEVLRWSRVVIIIERVNLGAIPEEKSAISIVRANCSFRLPSTAFGMDEGWIVCDQPRIPPSCQDWRANRARPDPAVRVCSSSTTRSGSP